MTKEIARAASAAKIQWIIAEGSCGYNLGDTQIEAAYVNGVALFAYESSLSKTGVPRYSCGVTGQITCGGKSMEEAKAAGVHQALKYGVLGADRRLTRKQFNEIVANPVRLASHHLKEEVGSSPGL